MRRLFWLAALVACTWVVMQDEAKGQPSNDIARHIGWGTTVPSQCNHNTGDMFYKTTSPVGEYVCSAGDVYVIVATGAGVSGLTPGAITKALTSTSLTDAIAGVDYALPGSPPTPGYQPNQTLSGCGVEYVSALVFNVGACTYTIAGVTYTIPTTTAETLSAGDATFPRIDLIGVDTSGAVFVTQGTPAASPAAPAPDASTQLGLTIVTVAALATTPTGVTVTSIYEEDTEWTSAVTAHFNAASTSNPYRGSKDIEATAAVLTNSVTLTKPAAGTEVLTNYNSFVFYIRSKAAWPTGTGASAARNLAIFWRSGSTQVGSQVILRDGTFGFSSSNTSAYQQITIPTALFGTGGNSVTSVRFQIAGNGGSTSIGFYLDAISLQGGVGPTTLPATLMNFKGAWSSTKAYVPNDTVTSGGNGYVALVANTNVAVSTTSIWAALGTGSPSAYTTVTFSATPTFDVSLGNSFLLTLTGNVTSSTLSNASAGKIITLTICQDGSGAHTFVPPTTVLNMGTIDATASACSTQTFVYDGTNAQALGVMLITGVVGGRLTMPGSSSGSSILTPPATGGGTTVLPQGSGALIYASDATLPFTDITTNDVSTTEHGFTPKAPGDSTKFLNGANPPAWAVPASAASGLVLLEQHTASSSAALNFTTCFTSTYDDYVIRGVALAPATDATNATLQFSSDGGGTYLNSSYAWGYQYVGSTSGDTGVVRSASDSSVHLLDSNSNASNAKFSFVVNVFNPLLGSYTHTTYEGAQSFSATSWYRGTGQGGYQAATALNAFRIIMSSGNLASGTVRCYGVAK